MTIDCASVSDEWRDKYSVDSSEQYTIQGFLFVHNYDQGYEDCFHSEISKINLQNLPIKENQYIHFMGPKDINRIYSIANDLIRLLYTKAISENYTFYYPDLVMCRRSGDIWGQPATVELLNSPYIIIKHEGTESSPSGYLIYYCRPGSSSEEFEYFLDSISRYQMLNSEEKIQIRVLQDGFDENYKSNFHTAKKKYARSWNFEPVRIAILDSIEIDLVSSVVSSYNPGDMGWRE